MFPIGRRPGSERDSWANAGFAHRGLIAVAFLGLLLPASCSRRPAPPTPTPAAPTSAPPAASEKAPAAESKASEDQEPSHEEAPVAGGTEAVAEAIEEPAPEEPAAEPAASAFDILLEAMGSPDLQIRVVATESAVATAGDGFANWCLERFDELSPVARAQVLVLFGRRGMAEALQKVLAATDDADEGVRTAAIGAAAEIGGAAVVDRLVALMDSPRADSRQAAREALARMSGEGVNAAIAAASKAAPPRVRGELLGVLASRNATEALDTVLEASRDTDETVRVAALGALGLLGGDDVLERALEILVSSSAPRERSAAEKAVGAICARSADKPRCARVALAALEKAAPAARGPVLRQLGRLGGREALEAVRAAAKDSNVTIQDAAVRALADWPDASAAGDLIEIARSSPRETHRVLALRAYVRVVSLPSDRPVDRTIQMLQDAMAVARRPDDKKFVLAALADVPHRLALEIAESALGDATLKAEAAVAVVKLARQLAASCRDDAAAALRKVLETAQDENLRREARGVLQTIEKYDDYITSWQVSGPYLVEGKPGPALFDVEFPPERADGSASWRPFLGRADPGRPWLLDLNSVMGGDNRAAYLRTCVHSPKAQEALLELGSDDGVKVWLNGALVHANNATRGLEPGQDRVTLSLREGRNDLMLKITQGGGDWSACARIRRPDGSALRELRVSAE